MHGWSWTAPSPEGVADPLTGSRRRARGSARARARRPPNDAPARGGRGPRARALHPALRRPTGNRRADGLHPLGRVPEYDARGPEPRRLALDPTRVRHHGGGVQLQGERRRGSQSGSTTWSPPSPRAMPADSSAARVPGCSARTTGRPGRTDSARICDHAASASVSRFSARWMVAKTNRPPEVGLQAADRRPGPALRPPAEGHRT